MNKIETASFECPKCGHIFEIDICDKVEKRHPDTNGVLPLTAEELREFKEFFNSKRVRKIRQVRLRGVELEFDATARQYPFDMPERKITDYKAILYLANLFELEVTE